MFTLYRAICAAAVLCVLPSWFTTTCSMLLNVHGNDSVGLQQCANGSAAKKVNRVQIIE